MEKTEEDGKLESKVDTKVIFTFNTGKKVSTLLPIRFADTILEQINDPFYDNVRSVVLLSIETAGIQCG